MSTSEEMKRIIDCWAVAEERLQVKHLRAFETLNLSTRCRKPSKEEVKRAWHALAMRLHPDRNAQSGQQELATEATRCINLAKSYLYDVHFGGAAARVSYYHEVDREEAQAKEEAAATEARLAAEAAEVAAVAAAEARLAAEPEAALEASHSTASVERPVPEASVDSAGPRDLHDEDPTPKRQRHGDTASPGRSDSAEL